jgi:hypothetical protein
MRKFGMLLLIYRVWSDCLTAIHHHAPYDSQRQEANTSPWLNALFMLTAAADTRPDALKVKRRQFDSNEWTAP